MSAPTKTCRRCAEDRPTWEFGADSRNADGLRSYCRECENARRRKPEPDRPDPDWEMPQEVRDYARRLAAKHSRRITGELFDAAELRVWRSAGLDDDEMKREARRAIHALYQKRRRNPDPLDRALPYDDNVDVDTPETYTHELSDDLERVASRLRDPWVRPLAGVRTERDWAAYLLEQHIRSWVGVLRGMGM